MGKTKRRKIYIILLAVVVILAIVYFVMFKYPDIRKNVLEESRESIRKTVIEKAIECYAVEGVYPENLEYLEKNYSLVVNHEEFIVCYTAYANNMMPDVQVLLIGEE